jgi:single-stranded DNA-binding protein
MVGMCKVMIFGKVYNIKKIESVEFPMVVFTMATFKKIKGKEDKALFHPCVLKGSKAEAFLSHVKDGTNIFIDGELDYYQKDGVNKTQVVANDWHFTQGKILDVHDM